MDTPGQATCEKLTSVGPGCIRLSDGRMKVHTVWQSWTTHNCHFGCTKFVFTASYFPPSGAFLPQVECEMFLSNRREKAMIQQRKIEDNQLTFQQLGGMVTVYHSRALNIDSITILHDSFCTEMGHNYCFKLSSVVQTEPWMRLVLLLALAQHIKFHVSVLHSRIHCQLPVEVWFKGMLNCNEGGFVCVGKHVCLTYTHTLTHTRFYVCM